MIYEPPKAIVPRSDERVVHLNLTAPGVPQKSLADALASLGESRRIDWRDYRGRGTVSEREVLEDVIEQAFREMHPTLFFAQVQEPWPLTPRFVERLRIKYPDCDFVSWCGDIVDDCHWESPWQYDLYHYFHLPCFSSMTQVERMRAGIEVRGQFKALPNAQYLQIGWDAELFPTPTGRVGALDYDVSFIGHVYKKERAAQLGADNDQLRRVEAVRALRARFGSRCGVFGNGWSLFDVEARPIPLAQAQGIYMRSRVGLSVSLVQTHAAYVSDRFFHILASGVPAVYADFPGARTLHLPVAGIAEPFSTTDELVSLVENFAETPRTIDEQSTALELAARHTWAQRMQELAYLRVKRRTPAMRKWSPSPKRFVEVRPSAFAPSAARPDVSIIFGTYNRREALLNVVADVRRSIGRKTYEIVVCDGGSTDGSREWLAAQPDVVLVGKRSLDGAVDAYNHAYAASRGDYILTLNDDCRLEGSIERLVRMLHEEYDDQAQVALRFRHEGQSCFNTVHAGSPSQYANYSLTHRRLTTLVAYIQGGYWTPAYYTYAGDTEFSLWVWALGLPVVVSGDAVEVDNLPAQDVLRERNVIRAQDETRLLYARWPYRAGEVSLPSDVVDAGTRARFREVQELI